MNYRENPKYDSALGIRPPTPRPKYLIPDGPWLNSQGQLHGGLLRWKAKQWQKSANLGFKDMHLEEVVGCVFASYASHPEKLAIDWEIYANLCKQHLQTVEQRLEAGIEIPQTEQLELAAKTEAILYEPSETMIAEEPQLQLQQSQSQSQLKPQSQPQLKSAEPSALMPVNETGTYENPLAYQEFQQEIPVDENFAAKWRAAVRQIAKPMPKAKEKTTPVQSRPQSLEQAIAWLKDPILKTEAVNWAKRNGYCIESDESGNPIDIYLF
ncbi:MAG: hypothetical protein WBA13_09585 [Microcoleaceae cyanobacterium]